MSRKKVLRALRWPDTADVPLPPTDGPWTTYADRTTQFTKALTNAGGRCVEIATGTSLQKTAEYLLVFADSQRVVSYVPGMPLGGARASRTVPRDYRDVDLVAVAGKFGVAENGAVWIPGDGVPHTAVLFLATHLAVVLDRRDIVNNMHEAYERLSFAGRSFGTFIAGPSKTADIEQALVIGAHGPRSLTVLLT